MKVLSHSQACRCAARSGISSFQCIRLVAIGSGFWPYTTIFWVLREWASCAMFSIPFGVFSSAANRTKSLVKCHGFSKSVKKMKNDSSSLPKSRDSETYQKNEIEWILIAKGIGVVLVVAGHFWPADSPAYWTEVRRVI